MTLFCRYLARDYLKILLKALLQLQTISTKLIKVLTILTNLTTQL